MVTVSQITKRVKLLNDLIYALQHSVHVETVESAREIQLCNDEQEARSSVHSGLTALWNPITQLEGCKIVS